MICLYKFLPHFQRQKRILLDEYSFSTCPPLFREVFLQGSLSPNSTAVFIAWAQLSNVRSRLFLVKFWGFTSLSPSIFEFMFDCTVLWVLNFIFFTSVPPTRVILQF